MLPLSHILLLFSLSVVSYSLWPHGPQHARLPCLSPAPGCCANSRPLNRWCHPTISSSVAPFSSFLQSFPVTGFFPISLLSASNGQGIGVSASASVLPMNSQDSFPLGWTGLISLKSKWLSRVFSNITVQNTHFMGPFMDFLLIFLDLNDCSFFSFTSRDNLLFFLAVMLHLQYAKTQIKLPKVFCHWMAFSMPITHGFNNHSLKIHFSSCKKACYHNYSFKSFLTIFVHVLEFIFN